MMISQMNQSQLLHWIDMVSFAVVEITEYLDTHPDDEEALKYFNHYADLRRTALRAYAQNYTPLTIDTANPDNYWRWASDPWPWALFILYHTVHNRIRQCIQLCLLVCMHCRLDGKSCIKDRHILHFTDFLFNLLCRCRCPGSVFHNCNGIFLNSQ